MRRGDGGAGEGESKREQRGGAQTDRQGTGGLTEARAPVDGKTEVERQNRDRGNGDRTETGKDRQNRDRGRETEQIAANLAPADKPPLPKVLPTPSTCLYMQERGREVGRVGEEEERDEKQRAQGGE